MPKIRFPIVVRRGHAEVKIYRTPQPSGYVAYTVAYKTLQGRKRNSYGSLDTARAEAEKIAETIASGEQSRTLTPAAMAAHQQAEEFLAPLNIPLNVAAHQFAEASRILKGASILDAARYYASHHVSIVTRKSVREVADELISQRITERRSDVYIVELKHRLGRIGGAFSCAMSEVTPDKVQLFLTSLNLSPRSYNNFRAAIRNLFSFARNRRYIPKDFNPLAGISKVNESGGSEIGIFTVSEMVQILKRATPVLLPALCIGAFAGLRNAEILRLEWSDVHLEERFIEVKKKISKTRSRRLVPITDNLAAWLSALRPDKGKIWPFSGAYINQKNREAAKAAGLKWKKNALRHSFISYRLAIVKHENQVALEAGNSPAVIFSNYRALVKDVEAQKWFSIAPSLT